jgi:hypothetical protein
MSNGFINRHEFSQNIRCVGLHFREQLTEFHVVQAAAEYLGAAAL